MTNGKTITLTRWTFVGKVMSLLFNMLSRLVIPTPVFFLENPRDGGAWWAAVYGVAQSWTQLKRLSSSSSGFLYSPTLTSYMNTGKTIALTRRTFVGKVTSLLFNMLSRLVITFLPRSKHLLISWLQSPSADIRALQNKVSHCFHCFPIYLP